MSIFEELIEIEERKGNVRLGTLFVGSLFVILGSVVLFGWKPILLVIGILILFASTMVR